MILFDHNDNRLVFFDEIIYYPSMQVNEFVKLQILGTMSLRK